MSSLPPLEYWFEALRQPVGIVLMTSDRQRMLNVLYKARADVKATAPELFDLSICISPTTETELWIVHKTVKVMEVPDESS